MKNKKGFTLIELLAVIVILAILMVIAIPKILNVIDSSRTSAASSSIKLIKDGIKTNVTSAEMTNQELFAKSEGCYLFDFDNNNTNVQNLNIDNKERAGGSIKLCNGKFSDDTLTFDGSSSNSGTSTPVNNIICKRATTLRSKGSYTFGRLGTKGSTTLTPGDAFDCKVSKSGDYTERFYYVSDYYDTTTKTFNDQYATFVYYNNTSGGVAQFNVGISYSSDGNSYNGPVTAISELPTTSQWNNISLYKAKRQLLKMDGSTSHESTNFVVFDYSGYAARLLTTQEVASACGPITNTCSGGEMNSCLFFMDSILGSFTSSTINYYWLETLYSNGGVKTLGEYNNSGRVCQDTPNRSFSVRPAIDIKKTNIEY